MNKLLRYMILALSIISVEFANAQLSDNELETLTHKVRLDCEVSGITDGARVYQTAKHWALVSLATVSSDFKPSTQNRQAQIIAVRNAIEFLRGAKNESVSIYDAYSISNSNLTTQQGLNVTQQNQDIDSGISTSETELSQNIDTETMSSKVIQSAIDNIDGLQPLLKFKSEEGTVYAFFMVVSKHTAKKKR